MKLCTINLVYICIEITKTHRRLRIPVEACPVILVYVVNSVMITKTHTHTLLTTPALSMMAGFPPPHLQVLSVLNRFFNMAAFRRGLYLTKLDRFGRIKHTAAFRMSAS